MAAQFINVAQIITLRSDEGGGVVVVQGGSDFGTDESYETLKSLVATTGSSSA